MFTLYKTPTLVMELAVITGLAALGYYMRKDEPVAPRVTQDVYDDDDYTAYNDASRPSEQLDLHNQRAIERFNQSFYPKQSGLIAPFYKIRSTNANDSMRQQTMEQYVGSDATWRKKRETEALFEPVKQTIDSSGREGNRPNYTTEYVMDSLTEKNQNALPFQQIQVGRGLGIGSDVPAADGFHPMLRVIPADGLSHKSTELGGRVNVGGAINPARTADVVLRHNKPPRVWDMSRRPLEKGMAAVTAPAHRGEHSSIDPIGCRVTGEYRQGVATRDGIYTEGSELTRIDDRSTEGDLANIDGPRAPGGYHTYTPGDTYRITSQHRETSHGPGPVEATFKKETMYCSGKQLLKSSKRSTYQEPNYIAGPQRNDAMLLAKLGYRVSPYMAQHHKMRVQHDALENRMLSHPHSAAMLNVPTQDGVGSMSSNGKKITGDTNPRNDFSLAINALEGNPYVV